jgi:hypothetical protein
MADNNVNKSDESKQSLLKQIHLLDRIMQQFFDKNTVFCKILSRKCTLEPIDIVPYLNQILAKS